MPRKSNMTPFTFWFLKSCAALRARSVVVSSKRRIVMIPIPSTTVLSTLGDVICSRVMVKSLLSVPRSTVTFTVVPMSPRILFTVSLTDQPLADSSFTATITSPACRPAFCAGEPSSARSTVGLLPLLPISAPIPPPILPVRSLLNSSASLRSMYTVYVSSAAATNPRLAPFISAVLSKVPSKFALSALYVDCTLERSSVPVATLKPKAGATSPTI